MFDNVTDNVATNNRYVKVYKVYKVFKSKFTKYS